MMLTTNVVVVPCVCSLGWVGHLGRLFFTSGLMSFLPLTD